MEIEKFEVQCGEIFRYIFFVISFYKISCSYFLFLAEVFSIIEGGRTIIFTLRPYPAV